MGPVALGIGDFDDELIKLSCGIVCYYCDFNGEYYANIDCQKPFEVKEITLRVTPLDENTLVNLKI